MSEGDWPDLIARLERDLLKRQRVGRAGEIEEDPWAEMRVRLHRMALPLATPAFVDDVVQNTLVKLQSPATLRRLKASRSPQAYLAVMLRNGFFEGQRKAKSSPLPSFDPATDAIWDPQEAIEELVRSAEARKILRELPGEDRELLKMRYWEDMSMADMARRLALPYPTVALRMFRLLRRLRLRLGVDEDV